MSGAGNGILLRCPALSLRTLDSRMVCVFSPQRMAGRYFFLKSRMATHPGNDLTIRTRNRQDKQHKSYVEAARAPSAFALASADDKFIIRLGTGRAGWLVYARFSRV
jgi:hypothetical protein